MNQLIPSKRFDVWRRLYTRFLLEPLPAEGSSAGVSSVILPVTDADRLLRTPEIEIFQVSVTGTGLTAFATVPAGRRWMINELRVARASGTMTHQGITFTAPDGSEMTVYSYASQAEAELWECFKQQTLDPGWIISVSFDAHSVTGNVDLQVFREAEDAF